MLALAEKMNVIDRILIIPGVPHAQVPLLLDQADIFINTSNYDTSPQSILEAMANGLCIVSTNVGGIPYLVSDQKEALLVENDQAEAMAENVSKILQDANLAAGLSENARKKAEQFDWDVVLPQWEQLFIEVSKGFHGKA
jgi:glycosyltransferase involved in cell wall biosynthesis